MSFALQAGTRNLPRGRGSNVGTGTCTHRVLMPSGSGQLALLLAGDSSQGAQQDAYVSVAGCGKNAMSCSCGYIAGQGSDDLAGVAAPGLHRPQILQAGHRGSGVGARRPHPADVLHRRHCGVLPVRRRRAWRGGASGGTAAVLSFRSSAPIAPFPFPCACADYSDVALLVLLWYCE